MSFFGDIYLFLWVVNSTSSSIVGNFVVDFLETLVILSAILLITKSTVASAVFCIALLEAVFLASVADFFSCIRASDKLLVQRRFFTNSADDLFPALEFLAGLYDFVI